VPLPQLAPLGVVEARQQQCDRGLAGARGADHGERLPRLHAERDGVEHRVAARVAERDVVQVHRQRTLREGGRGGRVDDVGLGVDQVVHPLHPRPGELRGDHHRPEQAGRPDQLGDVGGERQERSDADRALQREPAPHGDHADLAERGQGEQRGVEPGGEPGGAHPLGEQPGGAAFETRDLAGLLAEPLHHPHAGDGLLDVLGDVGRPLLRRPGGREQLRPGAQRDPAHGRQHHQRHEREQRREPQHGRDRRDDEHHRTQRQRRHRQQCLHQLQVGDRARHDLAGAQRVLPLAVEALHRGEHLAPQVVLHVEGEPAGEVPAQERRTEPHQCEPDHRRDDRDEHGRGPRDGVVDGHAGEQRAHRLQADPEHRRHESTRRHRPVAETGADDPADPAGGGSIGHI
jgi:hypothetical protein